MIILPCESRKRVKKQNNIKKHITAPKIIDVDVAQERPMLGNTIKTVLHIPLSMSYAVTIHKGQGLTIHNVDRTCLQMQIKHWKLEFGYDLYSYFCPTCDQKTNEMSSGQKRNPNR